jgi:hypothetical protein
MLPRLAEALAKNAENGLAVGDILFEAARSPRTLAGSIRPHPSTSAALHLFHMANEQYPVTVPPRFSVRASIELLGAVASMSVRQC